MAGFWIVAAVAVVLGVLLAEIIFVLMELVEVDSW